MSFRLNFPFGVQSVYVLRAVLADLMKRKFATLLTV